MCIFLPVGQHNLHDALGGFMPFTFTGQDCILYNLNHILVIQNLKINKAALGVSPNAILLQLCIGRFSFVPSKPSSEKFTSFGTREKKKINNGIFERQIEFSSVCWLIN
jgi:hypothetical protein